MVFGEINAEVCGRHVVVLQGPRWSLLCVDTNCVCIVAHCLKAKDRLLGLEGVPALPGLAHIGWYNILVDLFDCVFGNRLFDCVFFNHHVLSCRLLGRELAGVYG